MITIPIEIGDVILAGKFKNHRVTVKEIGIDEHGLPTVNGNGILKVRIEKLIRKKVQEEYMKTINELPAKNDPKIQRIVDEINKLIESAKDSDGDPLGVVDRTSTWEEPIVYEPIEYKNGTIKITTRKVYETGVDVDFIKKSNMESDGIPTLRNIMKMYKKAIKNNANKKSTDESVIKEAINDSVVKALEHYIEVYKSSKLYLDAELGRNILKAYKNGMDLSKLIKAVEADMSRPGGGGGGAYDDYLKALKTGISESKRNSKMTLSEVLSKGVFVTIKKEDGKFWFYIDNNGEQECISNVGFPTKEAAEHAALTKGFNVEKGGNAEDEMPETVKVPKPTKREKTPDTEKPKQIELGKEKEIKLEHFKAVIKEEVEKFLKKHSNLKEMFQKKNLTEAPEITEKVEKALNELKELQDKLAEAKAKIEQIKKDTNYNAVEKRIDQILKEELWDFFEELKKDGTRIVQLQKILMTINRFQAQPATYNYEKVLDFVMTQVNQDVKLKILQELKACETIGKTKGNVSFTQTEGIGDIWNSIKTYFQKLMPSLQSKGKKIDTNIQKLQNIVDKMK